VKPPPGFRADEFDQLTGVAKFAGVAHAGGQIARSATSRPIPPPGTLQQFAVESWVDPMQEMCGAACRRSPWISSTGRNRPVSGGAPRAMRQRKEAGLNGASWREPPANFSTPSWVFGGKELILNIVMGSPVRLLCHR